MKCLILLNYFKKVSSIPLKDNIIYKRCLIYNFYIKPITTVPCSSTTDTVLLSKPPFDITFYTVSLCATHQEDLHNRYIGTRRRYGTQTTTEFSNCKNSCHL